MQQQLIVAGPNSVTSLQTHIRPFTNQPIRLPRWIATGNPGTPSQNMPHICTLLGLLPLFGDHLALRAVNPDDHFFWKKNLAGSQTKLKGERQILPSFLISLTNSDEGFAVRQCLPSPSTYLTIDKGLQRNTQMNLQISESTWLPPEELFH